MGRRACHADERQEEVLPDELPRQQVEQDGAGAEEEHSLVTRAAGRQPGQDVGAEGVPLFGASLAAHAQHERLSGGQSARQRSLRERESGRASENRREREREREKKEKSTHAPAFPLQRAITSVWIRCQRRGISRS